MESDSPHIGEHSSGTKIGTLSVWRPFAITGVVSCATGMAIALATCVWGYIVFADWAASGAVGQTTMRTGYSPDGSVYYQYDENFWFEVVQSHGTGPGSMVGSAPRIRPTFSHPAWSELTIQPPLPSDGGRDTVAVGLPWRAFIGCAEQVPHPSDPPGTYAFTIRLGSSADGIPWCWISSSLKDPVPTHVRPFVLVANWMLWSIACFPFFGVVMILRHIRRRRRISEGLCPSCMYDLARLPHGTGACPECGSSIVLRVSASG
ncbi:MAG: hypothetical protein HBSAPP03_08270 [Phycisphaerae bacterium]|nr:MAG: hypothetical protein HBSAPP03_08270 [Phycisphaerae bacterium]